MQKKILIILLILANLVIFSNLWLSNSKSTLPDKILQTKILNNDSNTSLKPSKIDTYTQSLDDYKIYRLKLKDIVNYQNPKQALQQLESDIKTEAVVQKNCHSFTHAIGNYALVKYDYDLEKSIAFNLDTCGGGYLHGIIEDYLEKNPEKSSQLYTICTNSKNGACFHALGHGFMLKNQFDVEKSVLDCKTLDLSLQQVRCAEGLFMENFDSANSPDSDKPFLNRSDPFYPCSSQQNPYKNACYYYSGRYIFRLNPDKDTALQTCLSLTTDMAMACVRGMSAGIVRSDLNNPEKMESVCQSVPKYFQSCVAGAVNYHIFMLDDKQKTQAQMCDKFVNFSYKKTCTTEVQESKINSDD